MSGIVTANPAGRLDVLAYRLAERGAERIMPREWPVLAPHVEKWARRNLSPGRLGIAPILIYAAGAAAAAGGAAVGDSLHDSYQSGYINNLLQYWGIRDTPAIPKAPNTMVPPAPLTAKKVKTWTPDDLAEATAQRGAQYKLDTNWIRALNSGGSGNNDSPDKPKEEMTWIWVALAASAVGVILLLRR